MKKNVITINELIKRKGLIKMIREKGIKRISKEGEGLLNTFIFEDLENFLDGMKNEMDVRGKRVLDREIVESFINNKNKNEEINY